MGVTLFLAGFLLALLAPLTAKHALAVALSVAATLAWLLAAILGWTPVHITLTHLYDPWLPLGLSFIADALGRFALAGIGALGLVVVIYAWGYVRKPGHTNPWLTGLLPVFLASLAGVATAGDGLTFFLAWELMSLTSYGLVMLHHQQEGVRRAGFVYFAMTHLGSLFILAAWFLFARATGSLQFAVWSTMGPHLPTALRSAIWILALIGFGGKAGLVPLHVWLPRAHPVAPAPASALMSGVMVKLAVIGLLRTAAFLGTPAPWWGVALLAVGALSALVGVLYAVVEDDFKRLLAFSTIENLGVIAMAFGLAMIAQAHRLQPLAALAVAAGLIHMANHAIYKTMLFLSAGNLQLATGYQHLNRLGGLLARMPKTAGVIVLGSAAIAALPPLNGFVGEWALYTGLASALRQFPAPLEKLLILAAVLLLALVAGLALMVFVKAAGVAVLARPRTAAAASARELPGPLTAPLGILAVATLGLGLLPGLDQVMVNASVRQLTGQALTGHGWFTMSFLPSSEIRPGWVLLALLLAMAAWRSLIRIRIVQPVQPAWACGGLLTAAHQYSSTAYSKPLRLVFRSFFLPVRQHRRTGQLVYLSPPMGYQGQITPIFDRYAYRPVVRGLVVTAAFFRRLQSGSLQLYLGYLVATLWALLALRP